MSVKPTALFWVDMQLSPECPRYRRAGIRGGKRSSLRAAREAKADILRFDPDATVRIYQTDCDWKATR